MAQSEIYPATINYLNKVSETSLNVSKNGIDNAFLLDDVKELSSLISTLKTKIKQLENKIHKAQESNESLDIVSRIWRDDVLTSMNELREVVDMLETKVEGNMWPIPTYADLLFGIK